MEWFFILASVIFAGFVGKELEKEFRRIREQLDHISASIEDIRRAVAPPDHSDSDELYHP